MSLSLIEAILGGSFVLIWLFIAGMIQSVSYGYGGQFYNRGTYTTICLAAAVTLWTFIPALRLIYSGQDYAILTQPMMAVPQSGVATPQALNQQTLLQATGVLEDERGPSRA